jgi:phosphoserine phosphatase
LPIQREFNVLIARVIAEPALLSAHVDAAVHALESQGAKVLGADPLPGLDTVLQIMADQGDAVAFRGVIDRHFSPSDLLIADHLPQVPGVFVSDMDSTMIGQECIDELADFRRDQGPDRRNHRTRHAGRARLSPRP